MSARSDPAAAAITALDDAFRRLSRTMFGTPDAVEPDDPAIAAAIKEFLGSPIFPYEAPLPTRTADRATYPNRLSFRLYFPPQPKATDMTAFTPEQYSEIAEMIYAAIDAEAALQAETAAADAAFKCHEQQHRRRLSSATAVAATTRQRVRLGMLSRIRDRAESNARAAQRPE